MRALSFSTPGKQRRAADLAPGDVSRQFRATHERLRRIEAKALGKLKHPSRSRKLRSFLDN